MAYDLISRLSVSYSVAVVLEMIQRVTTKLLTLNIYKLYVVVALSSTTDGEATNCLGHLILHFKKPSSPFEEDSQRNRQSFRSSTGRTAIRDNVKMSLSCVAWFQKSFHMIIAIFLYYHTEFALKFTNAGVEKMIGVFAKKSCQNLFCNHIEVLSKPCYTREKHFRSVC